MSSLSKGSDSLTGTFGEDPSFDGAMAMKTQNASHDDDIPQEFRQSKRVYYSLMLFGLGMLTSWNVILNSINYFASLYTGKQSDNIAFYLSVAFCYPGLPILFSMIKFNDKFSTIYTIIGAFIFLAVSMIVLPFVSEINFWVCMFTTFLMGLASSLLQSKVYAFSSIFPPEISSSLVGGQGMAGLVATIVQIIVKLASSKYTDDDGNVPQNITKNAALAYFVFTAILLSYCAFSFFSLYQTPFTQFYIRRSEKASHKDDEQRVGLLDDTDSVATTKKEVSIKDVLSKTKWGVFSLFMVFFVTFLLFPGVYLSVDYRGDFGKSFAWMSKNGWWPVVLILNFNVFDTLSRMLAPKFTFITFKMLPIAVLVRALLIVCYFAAMNQWTSFFGDAVYLILNTIFAFSNGLLNALSFRYTPAKCEPHEKSTAGTMLSFVLSAGIMIGSTLALTFS